MKAYISGERSDDWHVHYLDSHLPKFTQAVILRGHESHPVSRFQKRGAASAPSARTLALGTSPPLWVRAALPPAEATCRWPSPQLLAVGASQSLGSSSPQSRGHTASGGRRGVRPTAAAPAEPCAVGAGALSPRVWGDLWHGDRKWEHTASPQSQENRCSPTAAMGASLFVTLSPW